MDVTGLVGEQTLPLPRKVRVLQGADCVLGSGYLGEQSLHRSGQGHRNLRVAHSGEQDGHSGLPRLRKLLLKIHLRLLCQSLIPLQSNTL